MSTLKITHWQVLTQSQNPSVLLSGSFDLNNNVYLRTLPNSYENNIQLEIKTHVQIRCGFCFGHLFYLLI